MEIINFGEKIEYKIALTLGYFDAIHLGHQKLIRESFKELKEGEKSAVILFLGDYKGKDIFSYNDRVKMIENLNVDFLIVTKLDKKLMNTTSEEFLNTLTKSYNIFRVCTGKLFRFGYKGMGDSLLLSNYLLNKGIEYLPIDEYAINGEKVSSTNVKIFLENGEIEKAKNLLGFDYYVTGVVEKGKMLGRQIGFPTANIKTNNVFLPKLGVYKTRMFYNNKYYNSITNVGSQPTVNGTYCVIETHIIDFNEDLYNKEIKIEFVKFIRDIKKFDSIDSLIKQLELDKKV